MRGRRGRDVRRRMDKMGMDMTNIDDVREVIIRTESKEYVITNPAVNRMDNKESTIFMVTANGYEEREPEVPTYPEEDIEMICMRANVDRDAAISALTESDGELATALLRLQSS